jgi:hypothetical protein
LGHIRTGIANVAVIVLSVGQAMENVSFKEDLRTTIGRIPAAGRLDRKNSPNLRREDTQLVSHCSQTFARKRRCATLEVDGHNIALRSLTEFPHL